jgi:hypothetical protein
MDRISNIFGARAKIFLQYDGNIETLASLLSTKLSIPQFRIETDQDPPHELSGLCEALGYEIWLNYAKEYPNFQFEVIIETELKFEESFNAQVYNISLWFARHVSAVCKLMSCAVDVDDKILYFKDGDIHE